MGMVKMKHMNIYGPEQDPKETLEALARAACFDPDEVGDMSAAAAKTQENEYAPVLTQTVGLLKDLGADSAVASYTGDYFTLDQIKKTVSVLADEVAKRSARATEVDARLATYAQTKLQLYHLTNLQTSMDEIFACKYLKVRFGRLPRDSFLKLPYYADRSFTFNEYDFDGDYYWGMYFVPEDLAPEVDAIFASLYFERMWVPDFVHGTPQAALAKVIAEENELKKEKETLSNMAAVASPADIAVLKRMASWLNYESQIFDMHRYVTVLEHSYYISGYVPEDRVEDLQKALKFVHGVKAMEDADVAGDGAAQPTKPPVRLKNNWFARPFEMFVEMYGLPGYSDLDPTGFVAVTYAVLFGAMFGDVGQGIVLGLVAYFGMYKKMHLAIGNVLARCSVFSVIFGCIYGSVFGFEDWLDPVWHALGVSTLPLKVMEPNNISLILYASIGAGVFIITAAIITGILSNLRRHIYARTVFSVNGLAGLVFYLSLVALLLVKLAGLRLPFVGSKAFNVICLVIPFISIYFAEPICKLLAHEKIEDSVGEIITNGFFDMFDALLNFASNTMSFLRVGGFVLAHAGMMSVVATLAAMTTNPVVLVIIYVLGNIFVMAMEGLFVAIQVLRLEFYEVFSRFFEATGRPFEPLAVHAGIAEAA